ncbi:hypothetical protein BUE80_DR005115 [Diplocarpon rosae]|nr:hypothetical protein BUE80_DR005115 [Diplocarpon rosae]
MPWPGLHHGPTRSILLYAIYPCSSGKLLEKNKSAEDAFSNITHINSPTAIMRLPLSPALCFLAMLSSGSATIYSVSCPKSLFQGGIPDQRTVTQAASNVCGTIGCNGSGTNQPLDDSPNFKFRCFECPANIASDAVAGCDISKSLHETVPEAFAVGEQGCCRHLGRVCTSKGSCIVPLSACGLIHFQQG